MNKQALANETNRSARSTAMDALRGIALLGIFLQNAIFMFRVSVFQSWCAGPSARWLDRVLEAALDLMMGEAPLIMFSGLFGAGLAAQLERTPHRSGLRRALFLGVLGALHLSLIWNGDILLLYAVCSVVVLALSRIRGRAAAAFLLVLLATDFAPLPGAFLPMPSPQTICAHVADSEVVYSHHGFLSLIPYRVAEYVTYMLPVDTRESLRVTAHMYAGLCLWRERDWLKRNGRLVRAAIAAMLLLGAAANAARVASQRALLDVRSEALACALEGTGSTLFAAGAAGAILLLASKPRFARLSSYLAATGRLTLSNYIVQSLVLSSVFYGFGFGLVGRVDVATCLVSCIAFFVLQVAWSNGWLAGHANGPLESLWRRLAEHPLLRV